MSAALKSMLPRLQKFIEDVVETQWQQRMSKSLLLPIYTFLRKPEEKRTITEIRQHFVLLKEIEFFQQLLEVKPYALVEQIWFKLRYIELQQGDFIFNYGDPGKTFYIILEGEVAILVPYKDQTENEEGEIELGAMNQIGQRTAGQGFGEIALIYNAPRQASVKATSKCVLAELDKEGYDEILANERAKDLCVFTETMMKCPMFSHWTKMSLLKMSYYFVTVDYLLHSVVYKEGDPASDVYIVVKGNFALTKRAKGKRTQNQISIVGPGEITGDEDQVIYTKSCICTNTEGQMLKISRKDFFRNIDNKESWKWHARKSRNQIQWRQNRLSDMQKFEEEQAISTQVEEEKEKETRLEDKSPYFRDEEIPSSLVDLHISRDERISHYLSTISLDANSPKYSQSPKRTRKSAYRTSTSGNWPHISATANSSITQFPEMKIFRNRSFMDPNQTVQSIASQNEIPFVNKNIRRTFDHSERQRSAMMREYPPYRVPGVEFQVEKQFTSFEDKLSPHRIPKTRRRRQVQLAKSILMPSKGNMFRRKASLVRP